MCGGGGDVKKGVMELKMGSIWVVVVNILSCTFMIGSAAARQDQTPSYEELGEMKKILHFLITFDAVCLFYRSHLIWMHTLLHTSNRFVL